MAEQTTDLEKQITSLQASNELLGDKLEKWKCRAIYYKTAVEGASSEMAAYIAKHKTDLPEMAKLVSIRDAYMAAQMSICELEDKSLVELCESDSD